LNVGTAGVAGTAGVGADDTAGPGADAAAKAEASAGGACAGLRLVAGSCWLLLVGNPFSSS